MFQIGTFSKLTQVSIRMLRYYDEVGLFKPARIDPVTGYRLYLAEQIPVLNKIIFLRDLGFQVSDIVVALDRWGDQYIAALFEKKRIEIQRRIQMEQDKIARIDLVEKNRKQDINYNVSIKSIPSYQVLSLRRTVSDYYAEGQLWLEMAAFAEKHGISISKETITIYHDADYRETDVDIEICAFTNHIGARIGAFTFKNMKAVPHMASTMVYGPFEKIAGAYLTFADWLSEHNQYKMTGKSRQIVHQGPWNTENPEEYLTEIQIPLERI